MSVVTLVSSVMIFFHARHHRDPYMRASIRASLHESIRAAKEVKKGRDFGTEKAVWWA